MVLKNIKKICLPLFLTILFFFGTSVLFAQSVIQIGPGYYAAGIPTEEFEYYAAPYTAGRQRQQNWCWAACIQMVLNYHGINVTQEDIVTRVFGSLVDRPGQPEDIMTALTGWGVMYNGQNAQIQASTTVYGPGDIISDLADKKPLIVGFTTSYSVGHACVLTAATYYVDSYSKEPSIQSVIIRDPYPDQPSRMEMSWAEFQSRLIFIARVHILPQ